MPSFPLYDSLYSAPALNTRPGTKPRYGIRLRNSVAVKAKHMWPFLRQGDLNDFGIEKRDFQLNGNVYWDGTTQGDGYRFGGTSDDYMTTGDSTLPDGPWSYEALIKINSVQEQLLFGYSEKPNWTTSDRRAYIDSSGNLKCQIWNGSSDVIVTWGLVSVGKIYHIIFSCDGINLEVAANGASASPSATGGSYGFTGYSSPEFVSGSGAVPGNAIRPSDFTILFVNVHDYAIDMVEARHITSHALNHFYEPEFQMVFDAPQTGLPIARDDFYNADAASQLVIPAPGVLVNDDYVP